jgi:hypothetical protein
MFQNAPQFSFLVPTSSFLCRSEVAAYEDGGLLSRLRDAGIPAKGYKAWGDISDGFAGR